MRLTSSNARGASFSYVTLTLLLWMHCFHIASIFGQETMCVCVCRPGRASRVPCEAESTDRAEGGQTGRTAAEVLDTGTRDSVAYKYRPLEELKRDMAQLELLVETDAQIMRRLLTQFNSSNSTTEQRLNILLELEYLVHQVLFAVASLLRHFPYAQRHFLSHGGLQVLSELFRADGGGVLRTRIVTMLYDMISEKELISQAGLDLVLDASHEERVRQYSMVSLQEELLEKGWCSLVPQLLESTEHDYREKALRALLAMAPVCLEQYRSDSFLLGSLLSLRDQYQDMAQSEMIIGDENSYFAEIVELIDALEVKMK